MQIPEALLSHLKEFTFFNEQAFKDAHEKIAPVSVRKNPFKPTNLFIENKKVPWCTDAYYLPTRPQFIHDALWHAGAYYVQEASSMFLQKALRQHVNFDKPLRILDLCAAPGGKSTLVASMLNAESLLISNEVIQTRVNILAENIAKWGRTNTWVSNSDPKHFGTLKNYFDVILIDAPCSGSGLFRKDNAAIAEWSESNVNHCSLRQNRIIEDVLPSLKNDGVLIYMTCSFSKSENEEIVDNCLAKIKDLHSLQISDTAVNGIIETQSDIALGYGYRFMPYALDGEGFFLAAFKKDNEQPKNEKTLPKKFAVPKQNLVEPIKLKEWLDAPGHVYLKEQENIFAIHSQHLEDLTILKTKIKLVRKGTLIGTLMGQQIIPDHDLALSIYNSYTKRVNISNEHAIHFMQKKDFALPECNKGWVLLCVADLGIGWIKNLNNRFNNYFPKAMRIRKEME
jgi:16S rRNA C967 or C1407 C5-methylase (RsmB/RsmF family)/NOL1/NOP2/fmu family ribosome biogenesis protein